MDPYCFLKWDAERFNYQNSFDPKPCTYMLLQHPEDFSEPIFTEGILKEKDVLSFIQRPHQPCLHEVRIIFSPYHDEKNKLAPGTDQHWPFTPDTYEELLRICGFFKSIQPLLSSRLKPFKVVADGITSMTLTADNYWNSFMQVLVSRDDNRKVTTIIVNGFRKTDQVFIEDAMRRTDFWRLAIHPVFIFALVAEVTRTHIAQRLSRSAHEAIKPVLEFEKRGNSIAAGIEAKNTNIEEEAAQALHRQQKNVSIMENIQWVAHAVKKFKSWCKDVDKTGTSLVESEALRTAGHIILARLEDIEFRLEGDQIETKSAQAFTQAHRQSLEVQNSTINNKLNLLISSQSRDIARESKRDSSAMKAIALLTMFFLPGTFVAAFFAMPLFDWEATTSSAVLKSRFWIYWAVTVPATAMVLVFWRMWFKFDHWRMARGEAGSFWKDAGTWLMNGRPEAVADDFEKGV